MQVIISMKEKKQEAAKMEKTVILGKLNKIGLNSQTLGSGKLRDSPNISKDMIGGGGP